jgi:3-hydroxyisobutyrate dehydrogenase-like beta-hydroxyacid dehydrogenase
LTDRQIHKVAFIGLGRMGTYMARNILRAGFDLTVYNRSPDNLKPLVAEGARSASTPMAAVDKADVVITCLMDDNSVMNVVTDEQGLLVGLKPGGIHIGTATISPSCAADLDELHKSHGSYYIAAPIFGRPDAAEAGTLLTYIAGNPDAIAD